MEEVIKAIALVSFSLIPFGLLLLLLFLTAKAESHPTIKYIAGFLLGNVGLSVVNCWAYGLGVAPVAFMVVTGDIYLLYIMLLRLEYYVFFFSIITITLLVKRWLPSFWKFSLGFMGIFIVVSLISNQFPGLLGEDFLGNRIVIHLIAFAFMTVVNWFFMTSKPFVAFEKWVRG